MKVICPTPKCLLTKINKSIAFMYYKHNPKQEAAWKRPLPPHMGVGVNDAHVSVKMDQNPRTRGYKILTYA